MMTNIISIVAITISGVLSASMPPAETGRPPVDESSVNRVTMASLQTYPTPSAWYIAPPADVGRVPEVSGRTPQARLENVTIVQRHNDLVERAAFRFPGADAAIIVDDAPPLNPVEQLTISVWLQPGSDIQGSSRMSLLFKSRPASPTASATIPSTASTSVPSTASANQTVAAQPWYNCQYGLMLVQSESGMALSFGLSRGEKQDWVDGVRSLPLHHDTWNHLAVAFDGKTMNVYVNGHPCDTLHLGAATPLDRYPTPLIIGACGAPPQAAGHSFSGQIGEFAIWDRALTAVEITALHEARQAHYPLVSRDAKGETDYSRAVNAALSASEDIWANEVLAAGDPSFNKVKNYLRPLFYSTGRKNTEHAPYNVVLSLEDGTRPLIAAAGDGSGIHVDNYANEAALAFYMGGNGSERFGEALDRLGEQRWEDGWLPVFHTSYITAGGARWRQEVAALLPAQAGDSLVVLGRFEMVDGAPARETLRIALTPGTAGNRFRASAGNREGDAWLWTPASDGSVCYYAFALGEALPPDLKVDGDSYREAKDKWCEYWRRRIEGDGTLFSVPEKLVMDCQRNKLYQNLVLRWRYSVGNSVYDGNYYSPESGDAMTVLAQYGYSAESRQGLAEMLPWNKGREQYYNWEMGEKLTHAAEYWQYTHDDAFIHERIEPYREMMRDFQDQMANDPHGLLEPQKHCGDIPNRGYYVAHQTTAWRGMRDMAQLFGRIGYESDASGFTKAAARLHGSLEKGLKASSQRLPDNTLYIPRGIYSPETTVYDPICETRLGSYWNLVIPYAFASGFWQADGEEMDAILGFLRGHGAFLAGLLRFNYYPTAIGAYTPNGIPGYYTDGVDNVYLPSIVRVLAARNETDALLLTFYSYLAHGMTRGTFISGEGDNIGVYPEDVPPYPKLGYRSMYGSVCNAQNALFLQTLRALLIQETYDEQGNPAVLRLTPATPRAWLEEGSTISFRDAPTIFGAVSGNIFVSPMGDRRIRAEWTLPSRNKPVAIQWCMRLPGHMKITAVTVDGKAHTRFDPATGVIDLTGFSGAVVVEATYR